MKKKHAAPPPRPSQRLRTALALALIIVLGMVVYGRCVTFDYTLYDDPQIIFDNPHVMAGLTWDSIRWALTTPNFGLYMPLPTLTFMLDRNLFGDWAGGYHGMTLLWHLICACTFFLVMLRLFKHFPVVLAATLFFTVHPVQAMTVNWISARNEIMPAFFMLLSIDMYRRYCAGRRVDANAPPASGRRPVLFFLLSLLFMFLGLMSKQGIVLLPVVLLLLDYWPLRRIELSVAHPARSLRRMLVLIFEKAPWFALSGVGVFFAFYGKADFGAFEGERLTTPLENLGFAFTAYARYLGHLIYPENFIMAYSAAGPGPAWWFIALSVLLLAGITALCLWQLWRRPWLIVCWGWFVLLLLPVSGLVRYAAESIALRYLYAPGMGLYLMAGFGVYGLACVGAGWVSGRAATSGDAGRRPGVGAPLFWTCVAVWVLVSGVLAYRQSGFWRDSETLARRALAVTDGVNAMAHNHLAVLHDRAGRSELAFAHLRACYESEPERTRWKVNYAIAINRRQRYEETLALIGPILDEQPEAPVLLNLYGSALLGLVRLDESRPYLERAVALEPDYVPARYNLALCLYHQGYPEEAAPHLRHALEVQPSHSNAQRLLSTLIDN